MGIDRNINNIIYKKINKVMPVVSICSLIGEHTYFKMQPC